MGLVSHCYPGAATTTQLSTVTACTVFQVVHVRDTIIPLHPHPGGGTTRNRIAEPKSCNLSNTDEAAMREAVQAIAAALAAKSPVAAYGTKRTCLHARWAHASAVVHMNVAISPNAPLLSSSDPRMPSHGECPPMSCLGAHEQTFVFLQVPGPTWCLKDVLRVC